MKKIYFPKVDSPQTVGERWFLECKFWKLYIMCGICWKDDTWTKRGMSYFKLNKDVFDRRVEKLSNIGIEFRTEVSEGGWSYRIILSGKKSNVELVDKLYADWQKKVKLEALENNYTWYENWYYDEEAWSDYQMRMEKIMNKFNLFK